MSNAKAQMTNEIQMSKLKPVPDRLRRMRLPTLMLYTYHLWTMDYGLKMERSDKRVGCQYPVRGKELS